MVVARVVLQRAGLDHVDDVDVGNVVQFAGTALAHADHGEADVGHLRGVELLRRLGPGHGEGRLERGAGEIRQFRTRGRHEVQRIGRAQVLDGELHEPAPVGGPQGRVGFLPAEGRPPAGQTWDRPAPTAAAGSAGPRRPRRSGSGLTRTSKASRCSGWRMRNSPSASEAPRTRYSGSLLSGSATASLRSSGCFSISRTRDCRAVSGFAASCSPAKRASWSSPSSSRAARNRSPLSRSLKPAAMRRRARLIGAAYRMPRLRCSS